MKTGRRILPLVFGVIITLALLCFGGSSLLAAEVSTEGELRSAIGGQDDTITVTGDIDLTSDITIDREVTVTGLVYSINTGSNSIIINSSAGNLTIDGDITITGSGNLNRSAPIYIDNGGTVSISSGTIKGKQCEAIGVRQGTVSISGGTIEGENREAIAVNHGTVSISGGTIKGKDCGAIEVWQGTVSISGGTIIAQFAWSVLVHEGTLSISGGKITGFNGLGILNNTGLTTISGGEIIATGIGNWKNYGLYIDGGKVAMSGGEINAQDGVKISGNCDFNISGGKISADKRAIDAAEGSNVDVSGDAIIKVTGNEYAVYQEGKGNLSISGGTITGEGNRKGGVYFDAKTFAMSGGSISCPEGVEVKDYYQVVISGGTIDAKDGCGLELSGRGEAVMTGGKIKGNDGVKTSNYCDFNISGGEITAEDMAIYAEDGNIDISGGIISGKDSIEVYNGKAVISGGEITAEESAIIAYFSNIDISGGTISGKTAIEVYEGKAALSGGNITGTKAGISLREGNVNITICENLEVTGHVYATDGVKNLPFCTVLPQPVTMPIDTETQLDITGVDSSISFKVDNATSLALGAQISGNSVTMSSEMVGDYQLVLSSSVTDRWSTQTLILTIPVKVTPPMCTVTFDKNGGDTEVNPRTKTVDSGKTVDVLPTAPTRAGYSFNGWNTEADGTGTLFTTAAKVTEDITVYAQWKKNTIPTCTVTFDKNGGDTEVNPRTKTVESGKTVDALPTVPTRAGYSFNGWNTEADGTGTPFTTAAEVTEDITVYAQWKKNTIPMCTVTFDKNGGDTEANPRTKTVESGKTVDVLPTAPTRAGYSFNGWNTEEDGTGMPFTAATEVTEDITVYAQWKRNSDSGSSGGGGGGGSTAPDGTLLTSSGKTFSQNGVTLTFPPGATEEDIRVQVKEALLADMDLPDDSILLSRIMEIIKDKSGNFIKSVTLTLSFDKSKFDPDEYDIAIYYYNEDTDEWIALDNIKVNLEDGTVSGDTDHFTKFAVIAVPKHKEEKPEPPAPQPGIKIPGDITAHWAKDSIMKVINAGVISGYPDGTFQPDKAISRAEFTVMLVKALKLQTRAGTTFSDTAAHWAKDFIATAAANAIISGYDQNTFGPDDPITREQAAAIIARAAKLPSVTEELNFTDSKAISTWARAGVAAAVKGGFMSGYPDGSFKPRANMTRAEAAVIIGKLL